MFSNILTYFQRKPILKRIIVLIAFITLWLSFSNFSSQKNPYEVFHYKSEIYADKAGYYIFLPATFIYGYNATSYPQGIDTLMGNGFMLDSQTNKVKTKYPCGVSILISPFFLTTHLYQKIVGNPSTAFTKPYFRMVNYASVFYLLLGLIFLFLYLKNFYDTKYVLISILITFFTTNLFYYSIIDTLMSHVYSFSMFSIYLWAFHKYLTAYKLKHLILISALIGIIILIRPINVLFLWLPLILNINSFKQLFERIKIFIKPINLLIMTMIVVVVLFPQLLYNYFISGHLFHYSYTNESFTNIFSPKFIEVLFSPMNGILLYTPGYIMFVIAGIFLIWKKKINGFISLFAFLLMLYISASWWCWFWGCSFSMRPFVDIIPFLIISLVPLIEHIIKHSSRFLKITSLTLILYFSYYTLEFSIKYYRCFLGSTWDWNEYNIMLTNAKIFPFNSNLYNNIINQYNGSKYVKIKTINNGFLNSLHDGNVVINYNNSENYSNCDYFQLIKINDSLSVMKNYKGKYLCSDLHLNGLLVANRSEIGGWEKFKLIQGEDESVIIKNSNNNYLVSDTLNQLYGSTMNEDSAMRFFIIQIINKE